VLSRLVFRLRRWRQFYPKGSRYYTGESELEVSIFNGETILRSLNNAVTDTKRNLEESIVKQASRDGEALYFAILPGFTSTRSTGIALPIKEQELPFARGIALFRLCELARMSGSFLIASGTRALAVTSAWPRPAEIEIPELRGTLVSFRVPVQLDRSLKEVYRDFDDLAVRWFEHVQAEKRDIASATDLARDEGWKGFYSRFMMSRSTGNAIA
jgi:hypothetical protein